MKSEYPWIRSDEMSLASSIAVRNLEHANEVSDLVAPKTSFYSKTVKRAIDVILSIIALIVCFPVNLVLAIATYFDVGSPIIFKQTRTGKDLEPFTIYKFRNMTNDRDEKGELLPPSQRVTKLGKLFRKTSLDELLNFWSVLKGDMSLIGPRPLPCEYVDRLSERHKYRYSVRPGLECPFSKEIAEKYSYPEPYSRYHVQFENDGWYVENLSFSTDAKLFFGLVRMTLDMHHRGKGAGSASPFIGYDEEGNAVSRKHYEEHLKKDNANEV